MTTTPPTKSARPYWHVDLKWIFGLLAVFALGMSLLLYNLAALTQRDRATTLSATIVASLFSKDGLDDEAGLAAFRQKAAATPGNIVAPLDQFPGLHISKTDAVNLSPKELRITIFRQLTDPIYDKGLKAAAADFTKNPVEQEKFTQQASLLGVFTNSTHQALQLAFQLTAIFAFLLMIAMIFFSAGWGRLVSPGIVLLTVSPLGAVAGLLLAHPPTNGDGPLAAIPLGVTIEIGAGLSHSYLIAAVAGILLLIVAFIGKLAQKLFRHRDHTA